MHSSLRHLIVRTVLYQFHLRLCKKCRVRGEFKEIVIDEVSVFFFFFLKKGFIFTCLSFNISIIACSKKQNPSSEITFIFSEVLLPTFRLTATKNTPTFLYITALYLVIYFITINFEYNAVKGL